MAEFLFAGWEGGGNVPPLVGAIRRLVARGHSVRILADDAMRDDVTAAGAEFRPWRSGFNRPDRTPHSDPLRDWEPVEPGGDLLRVLDHLMIGPAADHARDTTAEIALRRPHVLVSSDLMLGPMMAAEAQEVPFAVLSSNISLVPMEGMPPPGPGIAPPRTAEEHKVAAGAAAWYAAALRERLPAFNAVRATHGLAPLRDPLDQVRNADLVLLGTSRAFDFPIPQLPPRVHYVGPMLDLPRWAVGQRVVAGDDQPKVLIAMSSTFQDQAGAIQAVLDAADGLDVRVTATRGPALSGVAFRVPANAKVVDAADHNALMAEAACVVTHAGHGTVMRALIHGCPLLCLPMGRDQNDNAARVLAHGAGLRLSAKDDASSIRNALQTILADRSYARSAARPGSGYPWG